jgi:hypothetical protein
MYIKFAAESAHVNVQNLGILKLHKEERHQLNNTRMGGSGAHVYTVTQGVQSFRII